MKIACIADIHIDSTKHLEECGAILAWFTQKIATLGVDLVLVAGDVFERKSTPEERMLAARFFRGCAETAPVICIRGNHDALGELPLMEKLRTKHPITVVETAAVVRVAGAAVACLAWPRRAQLLALGAESSEQANEDAAGALRAVLRGLGAELAAAEALPCPQCVRFRERAPCYGLHENLPRPARILLTHAMVRGSVTSTGQPLVGAEMEIGVDDLALCNAQAVVMGHIHRGQRWDAPMPMVYPGSPRRTAFGETEPKGFVVLEIDGDRVELTDIATPCAPMLLVDVDSAEDLQPDDKDYRRALVRVRYGVEPDSRVAARGYADKYRGWLLERGAEEVKIEEVVRTTARVRAPEIQAATTLDHKLVALWSARGTVPEPERADRLLGEARRLEAEVS